MAPPYNLPYNLPENLARIRKARDLSQEQLAAAAGVAVDTVARIERGERQTTRPSTVTKLAAALGVAPAVLLGILPRANGPGAIGVTALRQAITSSYEVPGLADFAEPAEVLGLDELAGTAHRAWQAYVDGRHGELLHALPSLLVDARRLAHHGDGDLKAGAYRVLSTAYRLGAGIAGRFGLDDLAWTAAELALRAARFSDAPDLATAVSLRYLVWTLVRQGRTEEAERVAVRAAERIEPRMSDHDPERAGVFGNLLFNAASAAMRAGQRARAKDLLKVAHAAAVRAGRDRATESAIFGPRVAALQAVDQTVRLGDPETALRMADGIPAATGYVPAFWEAGHRLVLAAAATDLRNDRLALTHLTEARDLAPDWVQYQPLGVSTMGLLVDRAARRRGEDFAALAAHYGVIS